MFILRLFVWTYVKIKHFFIRLKESLTRVDHINLHDPADHMNQIIEETRKVEEYEAVSSYMPDGIVPFSSIMLRYDPEITIKNKKAHGKTKGEAG
jgi:hypothetical protein